MSGDCDEIRALLPELALGIATGDERAFALAHLAGCAQCRKTLSELSDVADELLLLSPGHEPPVGFESRVVERLGGARRPRKWGRILGAAAAAVLLAAGSAGGVFWATRTDRDLASRYRETLAVANGEYFSAAPLYGPRNGRVGHVFGYQGGPSWLFVVVRDPGRRGAYEVVATTDGGRRLSLGRMTVTGGGGSWGSTLPVDFHALSGVDLRRRGHTLLDADF
jgi:Putative zinc-finger